MNEARYYDDGILISTRSTIAAAVADIPSNLSGLGHQEIVINAGTYNESLGINVTRSNPSATDYIDIHPTIGDEHKGYLNQGVIINTSSAVLNIGTNYTRLSYLHIINSSGGWSGSFNAGAKQNCVVSNCIAKNSSSGIGFDFDCYDNSNNFLYNCLAYDCGGIAGFYAHSYNNGDRVLNCICYNCSTGFYTGYSALTRNCAAINCTSGFDALGSNLSYCASTGPITSGSGNFPNKSLSWFAFIDEPNKNFHVLRTSNLLGAGSDQSVVFTTDIDGDLIREWMIGFDYVSPSCWSYKAKYKNSDRIFSTGGPDKYPSCLKVPPNVDISTGRMTDEDILIDPSLYTIE